MLLQNWCFIISDRSVTEKKDEEKKNEQAKPTNEQVNDKQEIVIILIWLEIVTVKYYRVACEEECFTEPQFRYLFYIA
jgi:hypothetical protein